MKRRKTTTRKTARNLDGKPAKTAGKRVKPPLDVELNATQLAVFCGVSRQCVNDWITRGCPRLESGKISASAAVKWDRARRDEQSKKEPGAKERMEQTKAEIAAIELARLRGAVVEVGSVRACIERLCETIRIESSALIEQIEIAAGLTGNLAKLASDARLAFLRRCAVAMEKWKDEVRAGDG